MKLSEIAKEIGARRIGDASITSLCTDSRVAREGDLFFCYRGTHTDSHAFAQEAEARGVAAIAAERELDVSCPQIIVPDGRRAMAPIAAAFYRHPERAMKLVGVTGTNGKTTVTHMLYEIFSAAGKKAGLIGTLGARYGNAFVEPMLTTPDPVSLFSLLADMRAAGVEYCAMEVSAHALALGKVSPIRFAAGIFTNLTQDHLDFFPDMAAYGAAKRTLFSNCDLAVVNADDPFSRTIACGKVRTFGLDTPADCFAVVEEEDVKSSHFLLNLEDALAEVHLPMTGRHNVSNALAAAACAESMGFSMEEIGKGLEATKVEGRLEWVGARGGADIFIDFAHTPDGLEKSIASLRPHCKGKLIVLFGCGGNRDRLKRPIMGRIVAKGADFAIITSDNPRYEDPVAIIDEIAKGYREISENFVGIEEREKATEYAISHLGKGDILLIAGKGGEHEQEIMGIKYAYNDKIVVESVLEKLS